MTKTIGAVITMRSMRRDISPNISTAKENTSI